MSQDTMMFSTILNLMGKPSPEEPKGPGGSSTHLSHWAQEDLEYEGLSDLPRASRSRVQAERTAGTERAPEPHKLD